MTDERAAVVAAPGEAGAEHVGTRAVIRTNDVEAVHELWRAWLVAAVTPTAVGEPPQMFRIIDGRWCLYLRPRDAAPRWLGIDATPEQAEIHEAFRRLHAVINHAKTPILLMLGG